MVQPGKSGLTPAPVFWEGAVKKDKELAKKWFQKASGHGHKKAAAMYAKLNEM